MTFTFAEANLDLCCSMTFTFAVADLDLCCSMTLTFAVADLDLCCSMTLTFAVADLDLCCSMTLTFAVEGDTSWRFFLLQKRDGALTYKNGFYLIMCMIWLFYKSDFIAWQKDEIISVENLRSQLL